MKYLSIFSVLAAMLISFGLTAHAGVDPNLLLYFDFNEGSGNKLKDLSGHGHDAVINGASPVWDVGKSGSAID